VKVHQGVTIELGTVDVFDQHLDRRPVVQNHLRFDSSLAPCSLAVLDEFTRVEPGVGVALQVARCP
jgi:hypothetical protein